MSASDVRVVPLGYAEHAPPPDLAPFVACFWTGLEREPCESGEAASIQRVLPDGCVDIIFTFRGDTDYEICETTAVGAMTKPLLVRNEGPSLYVGARFRPGAAFAALRVPAAVLVDETVMLEKLERSSVINVEALMGARSNEQRLASAVDFVRRRLHGASASPRSVRAAVKRIAGARGNVRVASLASDIGITRQQLTRHFATHVGITPKMFARVMRAQAVVARIDAGDGAYGPNWTAIAHELGYYDQPHLIDDFKAVTGSTPTAWVARSTLFSSAVSMP